MPRESYLENPTVYNKYIKFPDAEILSVKVTPYAKFQDQTLSSSNNSVLCYS